MPGEKCVKATFKTKKQKIITDIAQCYASTDDSDVDVIEEF